MENQGFIDRLHYWFGLGERILLGIGVIIILIYLLRFAVIGNKKKKYDFMINNEIRSLKFGIFFIVIALILLLDNLLSLQFEKSLLSVDDFIEMTPFIGGFFVIFIIGVVIYSGIRSILDIYYPRYLGKRLDKIRYSPRISSRTGNEMKLLNEDEEDVYLTEQMQADENSLRYDYDVWLDEQSGDVQIEKYDMHLNSIICPECRYRTLTSVSDRLVSSEEGAEELQRDYECSYCGYKESKHFKVTQFAEKEKEGATA